jgi:hypothetical protein
LVAAAAAVVVVVVVVVAAAAMVVVLLLEPNATTLCFFLACVLCDPLVSHSFQTPSVILFKTLPPVGL